MPEALAQRVVDLSRLTSGLAHEIRNPLSTLKVNLQLLEEDWRQVEESQAEGQINPRETARRSRRRIATLLEETKRLETILDDFVQFVGKRRMKPVACDLSDLVTSLADFYRPQAETHHVGLHLKLSEEPILCLADVNLLKQAILNLLINAQQAMPGGGEIYLSTGCEGEFGRIEISDTGPGISPENQPHIFDAYFSTKKGGSGLGLATTQQIVQEHGGQIDVRSQPAQGAAFVIQLPLVKD